jgi:hypothetical protein
MKLCVLNAPAVLRVARPLAPVHPDYSSEQFYPDEKFSDVVYRK